MYICPKCGASMKFVPATYCTSGGYWICRTCGYSPANVYHKRK